MRGELVAALFAFVRLLAFEFALSFLLQPVRLLFERTVAHALRDTLFRLALDDFHLGLDALLDLIYGGRFARLFLRHNLVLVNLHSLLPLRSKFVTTVCE